MNKPNPADYGVTQADLDSILLFQKHTQGVWGTRWMEPLFEKTGELIGGLLIWTVLWPIFIVCLLLSPITSLFPKPRHPKHDAFDRYAKACEEYLRGQRDYWIGLSGIEFERNLAELFRRRGYAATLTRVTGDGGIDIELQKDGQLCIVQCKRYRKPAGAAVIRELYGAMIARGAQSGILACTGGFTSGVRAFVRDKPIRLMSLDEILAITA